MKGFNLTMVMNFSDSVMYHVKERFDIQYKFVVQVSIVKVA
jgi:hypothetical protein